MNQTALLMNIFPVAGASERIATGPTATWVRVPDGAAQEAALARAAVNGASPPIPAQEEQEAEITVGSPEWNELTKRRAAMIDKMYGPGQGPSEEEQAEFERLQRRSRKAIDKAFPRPQLAPDELAVVKQALGIKDEPAGQ